MGWSEQHRQPLHRELTTAQTGEPTRETILSLIGMLGQREIQDSKRVVASVLWRIEPSLIAGSRIAWSAAEFKTIMASLHQLGAIEVLRAYARDAMQRDPEDPTARFYRIVAQVKGNRDHLTDAQETELCDLMDQAGSRQDFHMLNRVQRFLDGPDRDGPRGVPTGRRLSARGAPPDLLDAGEMEEILGKAIAGMSGMPDRELRRLVSEFGRSRAIDMLADMMANSPLGEVLSGQQLANLCAAMVGRATEGRAQQARR